MLTHVDCVSQNYCCNYPGADPKAVSPTGGSEVYKQDKRPSIDSGCSCELDSHPFTDTEQTLSRKAVEILHMLGVDKPEGT
ncbi:hypothetical protein SARC_18241, partial [Sphaeroforma arctica JP610]